MSDVTRRWGWASVRVRVTSAAVVVALLGAGMASVLFLGALQANLEQALIVSAGQTIDAVQAQLLSGNSPEGAVRSGRDDVAIQIVDSSGHVVASDHSGLTQPLRTIPGVSTGVVAAGLEDTYVVVGRNVGLDETVVVALSDEQTAQARRVVGGLLLFAVPLGVLLLALTVWVSVGRALRPVEALRKQATAITADRLAHRLSVPHSGDELTQLAVTLNDMLDRIDGASRRQRQFVADASHELRSPLATLRQLAEVAQRYPERIVGSTFATDVLYEEQRMEALVSALLTLARADGSAPDDPPAVDLDDCVLTQVETVRRHSTVTIDLRDLSGGQVYGDPVLLGQMVANLLSNAVRHARSTVKVSLGESQQHVVLCVEDDGPGISVADRERVFGRFTRLDEARTRDAGGVGLGLAIVRNVAVSSGGRVSVDDSPLGGARFTVELPTMPAGAPASVPARG